MKSLFKNIFVTCAMAVIVFSLASCLGDDGGSSQTTLTYAQKVTYVQSTLGTYHSAQVLYYPAYDYNTGAAVSADTVKNVSWNISLYNDTIGNFSTMEFPVSIVGTFTKMITDPETLEILKAADSQSFNAILVPFFYSEAVYSYYLLPNLSGKAMTNTNESLEELDYKVVKDGVTHDVQLYFANYIGSYGYSSGQYPLASFDYSNKKLAALVLIKKVVVDTKEYTLNTFVTLIGSRL